MAFWLVLGDFQVKRGFPSERKLAEKNGTPTLGVISEVLQRVNLDIRHGLGGARALKAGFPPSG